MSSSPGTLIRPARPGDALALIGILHDTHESTWFPAVTPAAVATFRKEDRPAVYVAARGLQFWVAEQEGEVVGFVDWDGDFVNALHVRSNRAGMGVGSSLMDKAEADIARSGFTAARLETDTFNARSQAFYARRGYHEVDRYPDQAWNSGLTTMLLVKSFD